MCLDQLEVQGTDLRPMYRRDEGHFPGRPFLSLSASVAGRPAGWRWSSLISSEPTGLFFHLRVLTANEEEPRFPIRRLLYSPADSESNHFLSLGKVLGVYLSPALCPRQLGGSNLSEPPPPPFLPHAITLPFESCRMSVLTFRGELFIRWGTRPLCMAEVLKVSCMTSTQKGSVVDVQSVCTSFSGNLIQIDLFKIQCVKKVYTFIICTNF